MEPTEVVETVTTTPQAEIPTTDVSTSTAAAQSPDSDGLSLPIIIGIAAAGVVVVVAGTIVGYRVLLHHRENKPPRPRFDTPTPDPPAENSSSDEEQLQDFEQSDTIFPRPGSAHRLHFTPIEEVLPPVNAEAELVVPPEDPQNPINGLHYKHQGANFVGEESVGNQRRGQ